MNVLERLRKLCLALPDTSEHEAWGHPNFRVGKSTFVAFEMVKGQPSIAFRIDPGDADLLLQDERFFATPYGRGKWISMRATGKLDWRLIGDLVRGAHRLVGRKR